MIIIYSFSTLAVMLGKQHVHKHVSVKCSHNTGGGILDVDIYDM